MLNKIGVLLAVPDEAAGILANTTYNWQKDANGLHRSPVKNLILSVCGIGKANAAFALGQMFAEVSEVIMFGTSAGLAGRQCARHAFAGNDSPARLAPEKTGALYLCTEFAEYDMDATGLGIPAGITPFSGMQSPIISNVAPATAQRIRDVCRAENIPLNDGRVMSGDCFITDPSAVKTKAVQFGARLADMESAAAAKICFLRKKPFCAVRYVSDNADRNAVTDWQKNVKISAGYFERILGKL